MATTHTILASTTYGVPSGNYDGSSQDWVSDAAIASNYYRGFGGLQTLTFSFSDFVGIIHVEATLDSDANNSNWYTAYTVGDGSTTMTGIYAPSLPGNWTWVRLRIDMFDMGTINYARITY